jgi:hypothetical protein
MQNKTLPKINTCGAEAEMCRRHFFFFVKTFWSEIIAENPIWNWHIPYLCNELQEIGQQVARREKKDWDYIVINIPPGSSQIYYCF